MNDPKLSPSDVLIVFADLQAGIVDLPLTIDKDDLRRGVRGLAKLAKTLDIPVVVSVIPDHGGGPAQPIAELAEVVARYKPLQRSAPDSWANDAIRQAIEASGRKTLLVAGVATEIAVQLLSLSAAANGYRVLVVEDACGGLSARSEDAAFRRLAAAGVGMTSVVALAGEFAGDFGQPQGGAVISVVYDMVSR